MQNTEKIIALEAIRGIAAMVVVVWHLMLMLWPNLWTAKHHSYAEWLLAETPLSVFYSGTFAVRVFFVLSGLVLSLAFFQYRTPQMLAAAVFRRYPRLFLPAVTAVFLVYVLLTLQLFGNRDVSDALARPADDWIRGFYQFAPDVRVALREGFYSAYVTGECHYLPILWTMSFELQGSLLVYGFLAFFGLRRLRWLGYCDVGLILVLVKCPYLVDFVAGVVMADLYVLSLRQQRKLVLGYTGALVFMAIGLCAGSLRPSWLAEWGLPRGTGYWGTLGAVLVISSILFSPGLREILSCKVAAWLGRISFSLYLIHFPIMCSLGAWVFLMAYRDLDIGLGGASAVVAVTCIAASLASAHVMASTIEKWSITVPRRALDGCREWNGHASSAETPERQNSVEI